MAMGQSSSSDVLSDINVTPLVDVMLVLLVVMMVTASTVVTKSLAVDLPQGSTGASSVQQLTITITKDGDWLLSDQAVDAAGLRSATAKMQTQNSEVQALIAADAATRHERVVEVMDLLREQRVTRIAVGVTTQGD